MIFPGNLLYCLFDPKGTGFPNPPFLIGVLKNLAQRRRGEEVLSLPGVKLFQLS